MTEENNSTNKSLKNRELGSSQHEIELMPARYYWTCLFFQYVPCEFLGFGLGLGFLEKVYEPGPGSFIGVAIRPLIITITASIERGNPETTGCNNLPYLPFPCSGHYYKPTRRSRRPR